jgi:2-polyprenyl-3-methyl-5-hydroxy-6-metoxy-1,4-benzoquinol methylase
MSAREQNCPLCGQVARKHLQLRHAAVMLCRNPDCRLMFAFPQLDSAQLDAAYRNNYYPESNSGKVVYENTPEQLQRQMFNAARERFGPPNGKRMLDFGCGLGRLCEVAREYGIQTIGIEPDPCARDAARRHADFTVFANLDELERSAPETRFDMIVMWEVVEHLREPWKELQRLRKLLKKDGWLVLTTPNANSLRGILQRGRWMNIANPTHLYYLTRPSLRRVLGWAGFSEIEEWRFPLRYPGHNSIRRAVYRALSAVRLQGGLVFLARPDFNEPEKAEKAQAVKTEVISAA